MSGCGAGKYALAGKYVHLNIACCGAGKYALAGRYALIICNGMAYFLPMHGRIFSEFLIRKLYELEGYPLIFL